MLQRPDVGTERILALADFIEGLEPDRFSMSSWGEHEEPRCICGWYQQLHGHLDKTDWGQAADGMGLSHDVAHQLFHGGYWKPDLAAKALRHLAVTGELP
jgi:hypothetical protein